MNQHERDQIPSFAHMAVQQDPFLGRVPHQSGMAFYDGSSHSYLAVPFWHLMYVEHHGNDDTPLDISTFSFMDGYTIYLEEDCDAGTFIQAWTRAGLDPIEINALQVFRAHPRDLPHTEYFHRLAPVGTPWQDQVQWDQAHQARYQEEHNA